MDPDFAPQDPSAVSAGAPPPVACEAHGGEHRSGAFCRVCGVEGTSRDTPPGGSDDAEHAWRCRRCFTESPGWAAYCANCGQISHAPGTGSLIQAYQAQGLSCGTASPPSIAREKELRHAMSETRHVVTLYLLLLASLLLSGIYSAIRIALNPDYSGEAEYFGAVLLYGVSAAYAYRFRAALGPLFHAPERHKTMARLAVILFPLLTLFCVFIQSRFLKNFDLPDLRPEHANAGTSGALAHGILMTAILPAFFEEIAFRGVILGKLLQITRPPHAIIITSLLFAILHLNVIGFYFYLIPMALLVGFMRWKTGSLLPCIAIHFLHNAAIVIMEGLGK